MSCWLYRTLFFELFYRWISTRSVDTGRHAQGNSFISHSIDRVGEKKRISDQRPDYMAHDNWPVVAAAPVVRPGNPQSPKLCWLLKKNLSVCVL